MCLTLCTINRPLSDVRIFILLRRVSISRRPAARYDSTAEMIEAGIDGADHPVCSSDRCFGSVDQSGCWVVERRFTTCEDADVVQEATDHRPGAGTQDGTVEPPPLLYAKATMMEQDEKEENFSSFVKVRASRGCANTARQTHVVMMPKIGAVAGHVEKDARTKVARRVDCI